jgi:hypothetical protein
VVSSEIFCGSGFPAAIRFYSGHSDRGWKAAPTIKLTPKILFVICHLSSDLRLLSPKHDKQHIADHKRQK